MSEDRKLNKHLSPLSAWAYAIGTSVGWGSLVVTCNTYLKQAGPLGSSLGLLIGALIMIVISKNYAYMISNYPSAGGAYTYSKEVFGYDRGFITAWFLALVYFAMLWANATSLPLFSNYFIGSFFRFGHLYTLFGYEVYLGEALLSTSAILFISFLIIKNNKLAAKIMTGLAILFVLGIVAVFVSALLGNKSAITPGYIPDSSALIQIIRITAISPWAFIGFENISHSSEEYKFKDSRIFKILLIAVISTVALYIFVTILSTTAYPAQYSSWLEYIRDLNNLSGIEALPPFYVAYTYLGDAGITILMLALLALIITSLIGNITALSRLFYALGKDEILPSKFGELNEKDTPEKAILLVAIVSIIIPFIGRTVISWIVDVTTIGATLIYTLVSASTIKKAHQQGDLLEKATGIIGLILMIAVGLILLLPDLFAISTVESEAYVLFVVWSVLGFLFFRMVVKRDTHDRFGHSLIVWVILLSFLLFISLVWMSSSLMTVSMDSINAIENHYTNSGISAFGLEQLNNIRITNISSVFLIVVLFTISLGVILNNYSLMSRRARESETQLSIVNNRINTDPLTGVKSKHAFVEKELEMNSKIDENEADEFAIAVCDVNGLKYINDNLGHKAGDEHIKKASTIICDMFTHSPVYRTGGDEFVVYLHGQDYKNRHKILENFHKLSLEHIENGGVVVSLGISDFDKEKDKDVHSVFERADALMYEDKQFLKSKGSISR